jgi:hypothetical protein
MEHGHGAAARRTGLLAGAHSEFLLSHSSTRLLRFAFPPVRGEPGARPVELSRVMLPSHSLPAFHRLHISAPSLARRPFVAAASFPTHAP